MEDMLDLMPSETEERAIMREIHSKPHYQEMIALLPAQLEGWSDNDTAFLAYQLAEVSTLNDELPFPETERQEAIGVADGIFTELIDKYAFTPAQVSVLAGRLLQLTALKNTYLNRMHGSLTQLETN